MDNEPALFDMGETTTTPRMSPDQRRTVRQRRHIDAGYHPLLITAGYPRHLAKLHPNAAPELCSPERPKGQPYTCGSCAFREVLRWHDYTHPKCTRDVVGTNLLEAPSITHGPATDVRAWWPACRRYEPGASEWPDAMRVIPE